MYIYKKSDTLISEDCDSFFENHDEKMELIGILLELVKKEKLVNLRRHVEICDKCRPSEEVFIIDGGERSKLSAGELLVNVDGRNYLISTKVIHNIQIHNCRPNDDEIDAIKKYFYSKYSLPSTGGELP